jgi:hypothetical protein
MKNIILILFLLINSSAFCQIAKYKSFETGISRKVNGNFYTPKFEKEQTIIVLDTKQSTLSFFGKKEFKVDIYKGGENYLLKNGDEIMEFYAIDAEGKKCLVRLRVLKNPAAPTNYTNQIWLVYDDLQIIYNGF